MKKDLLYFADIDYAFIKNTKDIVGLEDGVLVHCQQAVEKYIKYILLKQYGLKELGHNVVKLFELMIDYKHLLRKHKHLLRFLKDSYYERRYDTENYTSITYEEYIEYLEESIELIEELRAICIKLSTADGVITKSNLFKH